jgi:hypothetical protein
VSERTESRSEQEQSGRRPYEAPQVAQVNLHADEVLAIGCKTLAGGSSPLKSCVITTCGKRGLS